MKTHKEYILEDGTIYYALILHPTKEHMYKATKKQKNRTERRRNT